MDVEAVAREITDRLRELGRGSRQAHHPSAQDDFGVYTPELRALVRAFRKRLAHQKGEFIYQLALSLLQRRIIECRQVAYELIAGHAQARESLNVRRIEALATALDNWACVDHFCCTLVGRAWREGRISDATIARWGRSPDRWLRRAALVSTVPLNVKSRGGTGDAARTLMVCRSLVQDKEIMVQKAISWALRELVSWDRKAVERFLEEQGESVSPRVQREVLRKLKTGKKN